ncbi:MAG: NirD/YgiW/YdeI family stress tolerance protein [Sulfurospirillaceae bacterium]|nr:NirD/YgiW/YdeI family stress tolerance protein [Sulfurospirillaceae bacterium]
MKNKVLLASLILATSSLFAQNQGGFTGPTISKITVVEAKKLCDDTPVVLEGNIVKHLGSDKYMFKDETGDITVEIENKNWNGITVGENDKIILYGEVDKDWNSIEIDVDKIMKR